MESNAVLELKAKNAKLKALLKAKNQREVGLAYDALQRRNLMLDALHMVWCSGGCGMTSPVSAELVAYVQEYAKRLSAKYVNMASQTIPKKTVQELRWDSVEFEQFMDAHRAVWANAEAEIEWGRERLANSNLSPSEP